MNILIAGAGPIAFLAGIAAKKAGFAPQVLGRFTEYETLPAALTARVVALSPASVSFLKKMAVWPHVDPSRCAPMQAMKVWSSPGEKPLQIDALASHAPALATVVEHCNLMRALQRRAREIGLVTHPTTVQSVSGDLAQVQVQSSHGGHAGAALLIAEPSVRAQVAALSDCVRTCAYRHSALVFNVRLPAGHGNVAFQQFAPPVSAQSVIALLPLPHNMATVVWSLPDSEAQAFQAATDEALAQAVCAAFQHPFGQIEVVGARALVALALTQVSKWCSERCALVGDAAHTIHPLAGQGLNLGCADVAALTEAWRGAADPGHPLVLARYARARVAATGPMQFATDALWRSVAGSWQAFSPLRDAAFGLTRNVSALQRAFAAQAMGAQ